MGLARKIIGILRTFTVISFQISEYENIVGDLQEKTSFLESKSKQNGGQETVMASMLTSFEGNDLFNELQMSGLARAMSVNTLDEPGAVRIGQQVCINAIHANFCTFLSVKVKVTTPFTQMF